MASSSILKQIDSIKAKYQLDSATVIVQKSYYNADIFNFKYYRIYKNKKVGLWNTNFIILPKYDNVKAVYDEKTKQIMVGQNGKYGFINEKEEIIIPIEFSNIVRKNENLFITTKNNKQGAVFLNSTHKNIDNKYNSFTPNVALPVNSNWVFMLFYAIKNNRVGYVGENGVEYFKDYNILHFRLYPTYQSNKILIF